MSSLIDSLPAMSHGRAQSYDLAYKNNTFFTEHEDKKQKNCFVFFHNSAINLVELPIFSTFVEIFL